MAVTDGAAGGGDRGWRTGDGRTAAAAAAGRRAGTADQPGAEAGERLFQPGSGNC